MTVKQQWGAVLGVILLLGGGLIAATRYLGDELFPVSVGSKAPDFTARTLDATPLTKTLADYKGQVVLLNVWATWCAPCRDEIPYLQSLYERHRAGGRARGDRDRRQRARCARARAARTSGG